jgi:hypothetical protein
MFSSLPSLSVRCPKAASSLSADEAKADANPLMRGSLGSAPNKTGSGSLWSDAWHHAARSGPDKPVKGAGVQGEDGSSSAGSRDSRSWPRAAVLTAKSSTLNLAGRARAPETKRSSTEGEVLLREESRSRPGITREHGDDAPSSLRSAHGNTTPLDPSFPAPEPDLRCLAQNSHFGPSGDSTSPLAREGKVDGSTESEKESSEGEREVTGAVKDATPELRADRERALDLWTPEIQSAPSAANPREVTPGTTVAARPLRVTPEDGSPVPLGSPARSTTSGNQDKMPQSGGGADAGWSGSASWTNGSGSLAREGGALPVGVESAAPGAVKRGGEQAESEPAPTQMPTGTDRLGLSPKKAGGGEITFRPVERDGRDSFRSDLNPRFMARAAPDSATQPDLKMPSAQIAVSSSPPTSDSPGKGGYEKNKTSQHDDNKQVTIKAKLAGIDQATGFASMSFTTKTSFDVAPVLGPSPAAGEISADVTRLLERVEVAATKLSEGKQSRVEMNVMLDGHQKVTVKLAWEAGQVHTDFRSDSGELNEMLANAWTKFSGRMGSRDGSDWIDPAFGLTAQAGPAKSSESVPTSTAMPASHRESLGSERGHDDRRENFGKHDADPDPNLPRSASGSVRRQAPGASHSSQPETEWVSVSHLNAFA